ncbi:MAG: hypothetical protein ABJE95_29145 [Byssovorax sp.]
MPRSARLLPVFAVLAGCSPELGAAPFACDQGGACPDGYTCQSTVCLRDGDHQPVARAERIVWINSGEMYWMAGLHGGAALIVNDGFTPGAHGIYELLVTAAGDVSAPRLLHGYGDEFPIASSIVALDDGHYGAATLRFPDVDGDDLTLDVLGIEREAPAARAPVVTSLYTETTPYLGGSEPTYVGAASDGKSLDVAWTLPTAGGKVEVLHLVPNGAAWKLARSGSQPLPPEILPLSGDCLLYRTAPDRLTLRLGFERYAVASIDETSAIGPLTLVPDLPLFAFSSTLLTLRYGAHDAAAETSAVSYALTNLLGQKPIDDAGYTLQDGIEPFTAVAHDTGALIAPISRDPAFPRLDVGFRSPTTPLTTVASIDRGSTDRLYSARGFVSDSKAYVAWTSFHDARMDLWIAVTDPTGPLAAKGAARVASAQPSPRRALSWATPRLPSRSSR